MEGWCKLIVVLFIAISCLHIHCDAFAIPHEISRRAFAAPDPEEVVNTGRLGLTSVLIAAQHTMDNEYKLIQAKKEPTPGSATTKPGSSDFGASTADLGKKNGSAGKGASEK